MAKYKAYSEYRDSGVEWLGEIPAHWNIKRLGQFFEERRVKVSDKDYPALSVTMQGIVPQLDTAAKTEAGDNRKLVLKDDFVINSRSDRKGSAGISRFNGSVSLISIVMRPKSINPRFAHYLLRSRQFQEEFYRYGKGIVADLWSTNSSEMKNILLPEIQFLESEQIASFLNHETAKIDNLIEKQQQLIELLKEKRQAVISHAVTKGLNPDVPMKDSGIEWLDSIPSSWEVKPTYAICSASTEKNTDGLENNVLSLSYGNIIKRKTDTNFGLLPDSFNTYQIVKDGDIILRLTDLQNDKNSLRVGLVTQSGIITPAYLKLSVKHAITPSFSYYLLHTYDIFKVFYGMGGGLRQSMKFEDFRRLPLLIPSKIEQESIVTFIDKRIIKIDILIEKQLQQIALLKERRTALISAAVTGKIDVRNWRVPNEQTAGEAEVAV
ncbi:restriction endonuclease subunit S [Citrobacter freundii]|uniref:restriction endonuclease subunit S n=1 Tax=Citrobacter TaxID=544 RepID=UPI00174C8B12|nr:MULTISPECIES: restriction endonuclease subunit S [unclassified Citrobacter]MBY5090661.1 restriction endonuclease subunit S [Citrobacter freundii]MDM2765079.1 restriction endonuclease subunit S [Citrobacter sp. Cpo150]MDM2922433.1 restriction endonuclease subunit S [Citrobacter sp. Cpo032]NTZ35384.1 restriction endonuclease subunit S [Citrobacter freundii]UDV52651.1 restriction endonuclease subunit S [Citrobacter freundii]